MTGTEAAPAAPTDQHDPAIASLAGGLLREFNQAGVLDAADVHVASRLAALGREGDDRVVLAVALAVRAVRLGSVCVEPATIRSTVTVEPDRQAGVPHLPWPDPGAWHAALAASPLLAQGPGDAEHAMALPVRYVGGLLYLDRYWREEQLVRHDLDERAAGALDRAGTDRVFLAIDRLFAGGDPLQRLAAALAVVSPVSVLTGGPGTGKTTTVARIIATLLDRDGPPLRVALAAPTGKAAARLQEAVGAAAGLPEEDRQRLAGLTASTIHRLLGSLPGSRSRFRHGRENRLPYDVVVVDETSMVSLTLMARLLDAVRPDARVILVGDPDQLASVEAGAVLGDIVARPPAREVAPVDEALTRLAGPAEEADVRRAWRTRVVRLRHVYRTDNPAINVLADAIREGDAEATLQAMSGPGIEFVATTQPQLAGLASLRRDVLEVGESTFRAATGGDCDAALAGLDRHRLLCAHRDGPFGVASWGAQVERLLRAEVPGFGADGPWYTGRPVVVTANDYELGLFNGDSGVAVRVPPDERLPPAAGAEAAVMVAFSTASGPRLVTPARLSVVLDVHAMTVHRAQGSEFDAVTVVLPEPQSPLLTRELLYTAVTRARTRVRIVGSREAVEAAVQRPVVRASGLRRVWQEPG